MSLTHTLTLNWMAAHQFISIGIICKSMLTRILDQVVDTRSLLTLDKIVYLSPTVVIKSAKIKSFGLISEVYSFAGKQNVTNEILIKRILTE
jgi:hypothetical protein